MRQPHLFHGRAFSSDEDGDGPGLSIQLLEILLITQLERLLFAQDLASFTSTFRAFIDNQRLHEVRWSVTVDGHTFAAEETHLYLEQMYGEGGIWHGIEEFEEAVELGSSISPYSRRSFPPSPASESGDS